MREYLVWALHNAHTCNYLFCKLNFLTKFEVIFELQIDVVVTARDAPTHATQNFVKRINLQSRAEVASHNQHVTNLLQKLTV